MRCKLPIMQWLAHLNNMHYLKKLPLNFLQACLTLIKFKQKKLIFVGFLLLAISPLTKAELPVAVMDA